jgi:hypothetical protein
VYGAVPFSYRHKEKDLVISASSFASAPSDQHEGAGPREWLGLALLVALTLLLASDITVLYLALRI